MLPLPSKPIDFDADAIWPGDEVMVTGLVRDAAGRHPMGIIPAVTGQRLEVVRVVMPFILAQDAAGRFFTLDTRRQTIVRLRPLAEPVEPALS